MSTSTFVSTADTISGLNDPSMSDERESNIFLRGMAFAYTLSQFAGLLVPMGLAVTGSGMWSFLAFIVLMSPSFGLMLYCRSEGLSPDLISAKASRRRKIAVWITGGILVAVFIGALAFHSATGHPLIDVGSGFEKESDGTGPSVTGGLIAGGLVGGACAACSLHHGRRLAVKREQEKRFIEE